MKRLYLIRHAKSSWKDSSLADFERPLNKRGKRNAPFMGKRLQFYQILPALILSSPAKRARKTARMIAQEIGFPKKQIVYDDDIYDASTSTLFHMIRNLDDAAMDAMLFGHNPGITTLAECLTDTLIENVPTCGIFCIDFAVDSWSNIVEGSGTVVFFDYPRKHP